MGIIFMLIGISSLVAIVFLIAFLYAVKSGQYDDMETPARRMLLDDFKVEDKKKSKSGVNNHSV